MVATRVARASRLLRALPRRSLSSARALPVVNPYTRDVFDEVAADDDLSVAKRFVKASKAQEAWAATPAHERLACVSRFADALRSNADEIAATLTEEMGKPTTQAKAEVLAASRRVSALSAIVESEVLSSAEPRSASRGNTVVERVQLEPVGVVAHISAWNYPHLLAASVCAPALALGNAVLHKPSEKTPLSGALTARLLHESGVPEGVFQVAQGDGDVGRALCSLRGLGAVAFTGSRGNGGKALRATYAAAADANPHFFPALPRTVFELGGKDAVYVRADVEDVAAAARSIAGGKFYNAGQSCCAPERIYVHESIADGFVDAFVAEAAKLQLGDPTLRTTTLGPLALASAPVRVEKQVREAEESGAFRIAFRGKAPSDSFFPPTVLVGIGAKVGSPREFSLTRDETFGPAVAIVVVRDDATALEQMADSDYGLTASVYSSDGEFAERALKSLNVGTGYVNSCNHVSVNLPWGGRGESGHGATLGIEGVRMFTKVKSTYAGAICVM